MLQFGNITIRLWGRCLFTLAGVAGAVIIPARADTLRSATTLVGCSVYDTSIQNPTSCIGFSIFTDAEAALFPSVSLSAEVLAPPFGTARASAAATYYFQVVGGNVGDIVPIMVQTSLSAFSLFPQDPHGWAQANLTLFSSADGFRRGPSICTYVSICGSFVTEFSGTRSIHAASGATGDFVNLTVEAFAGTSPDWDYPEFGRAFADPYIFIDPTFPNASLYSIVVSPGVGNAAPAAVPEPATLWFVGTSVGALGLLRRRQSRMPVAQRRRRRLPVEP